MNKFILNQPWELSFINPLTRKEQTVPARVPGNVIGDLERAGLIPDPYFGTNSNELRCWEFIDWEYRTTFDCPEVSARQSLYLVFEGLDTFGEIFINGQSIGKTDNMVIGHEFALDPDKLLAVGNELKVKISSTVNEARKYPLAPYSRTMPFCYEGLQLRRPMHTYGWDIAPRIVGAGLWRSVYLKVENHERWLDTYLITAKLSKKSATVYFCWNFTSDRQSLEGYEANLKMTCGNHTFEKRFTCYFCAGNFCVTIPDPQIWQPYGHGTAHLYQVKLDLIYQGEIVDTKEWKTGLRTIELVRSEDGTVQSGGEFYFKVNGKKFFVKGSNWVPSNAIHGEQSVRVRKNLELFSECGCNMLRFWGGNVYEDDELFDYCDEHGIMVWQDFMFACEVTPQNEDFLKKVQIEAEYIVKKLRNHPSLALWSGDNECDMMFLGSVATRRSQPSFNRVTREILPRVVTIYDGLRDYLPSSPYLSDKIHRENFYFGSTEQHPWGSREYWKNPFYRNTGAVFASEIGSIGMTSLESLKKFIPENELDDRFGYSWICHNSQQFNQLDGLFAGTSRHMHETAKELWGNIPDGLENFIPRSQIVQAEAFKYFVELFRSTKWQRTGIIWWQMIDCWPGFSPAVVDYYYNKKPAFYYLKHAQMPFLMTLSDPEAWTCHLNAVNDTCREISGTFRVSDILSGKILAEGEFTSPADDSEVVCNVPVSQGEKGMLLIEWTVEGTTCFNHYLAGHPPFDFEEYCRAFAILQEKIYNHYGMPSDILG